MLLSDVTLEVLANFCSINQGLIFKPGNELATMSTERNIFAVATIEETIPVEFAIYDLKELLGVYFTYTRYEKQIRVSYPKNQLPSGGWNEKTKEKTEKPIKEQLEELRKNQLKLVAKKDEILKEIQDNTATLSQLTYVSKSVRTGIEKEVKSAEKKVSDLEEKIHKLTLEQGELIAEDNKRKAEAEEAARKRKEEEEKRKEEKEKKEKMPVWMLSGVIDYSDEETAEEGLNFREEYLLFKSEESKLRYFYNNPSVIISPGDKRIKMENVDNKFVLPVSILKQIWKYESKLKVQDLTSTEAGFKIWNRTRVGNEIEFNLDYQMKGGNFRLKLENLKFIPLDYDVEIDSGGIAHFISRSPAYKVEYFIALETIKD